MGSTRLLPGPLRGLRDHLRAIRAVSGETRNALAAARVEIAATRVEVAAALSELGAQVEQMADLARGQAELLAAMRERMATLETELHAAAAAESNGREQLVEILRFVLAQGPRQSARLRQLRKTPSYEHAYSEREPLVSVVIPTYDRFELLGRRAIPSVLAQTYQNFEIVVVGDAAPDQARTVVDQFGDPRLSFYNLPYRGPYPSAPEAMWLVAGAPPLNEGVRRARGQWIAMLGDDDAFREDHIDRLLRQARSERLELVYGRLDIKTPDAPPVTIGRFPPELAQFGLQAALYHAALADIFECELADGALRLPADYGLCRRMMEAGVRIGFLDAVTVDYYPSKLWANRSL